MRTATDTINLTHNRPYRGEVLRESRLEPAGVAATDAAKSPGARRKTPSSGLNGPAGISPEMAVRRSIAIDTAADSWINQHNQYELRQAQKQRKSLRVSRMAA